MMRAQDMHAHIGANWPALLASLGIGEDFLRKKAGPCPACGGTDRFTFDNRKQRGDYFCRQCGAGDGFQLLTRVHGWDFSEARRQVLHVAGLADESAATPNSRPQPTRRPVARTEPLDWSTRAESIWRGSQPLGGTIGESYLRSRGCALPPQDSHLRFLPSSDQHPPSLCAAVTDVCTGQLISLHFTRLAKDGLGKAGTDRDKVLLKDHRKRGGCIRLWPDECVTRGLAIAEGVETALAAAHINAPTWATIDAAGMSAFPVLAGIGALTIFADNDEAGLRAAQECAGRWKDAQREARVFTPSTAGHDVADEVAP